MSAAEGSKLNYVPALILAACLGIAPANAAVVGVVDAGNGASIELHDVAGPCVSGALTALYRPASASREFIPGCWVMGAGVVAVAFLDGDVARIPVAAVKKPTPA